MTAFRSMRPVFLITIDTEGDDLWSRPKTITTRNAEFLPRFQTLCETFHLRPTYLVDYEMSISPAFQAFGRDFMKRRTGEIGMHLHAWNTPPLAPLTGDDFKHQPYLLEYPPDLMQLKVRTLTDLLEEQFGIRVVSHRAGRWGLNGAYARVLVEAGYRVDCSVTPYISWRHHLGDPKGCGGPDYTAFPGQPYFIDLEDISRPGYSPLLEVPVTIVPSRRLPKMLRQAVESHKLVARALNRLAPPVSWLRPNGRNRDALVRVVDQAVRAGASCLELMLHSSELMAGGSPRFRTSRAVEGLYRDLELVFELASETCTSLTLREFYGQVCQVQGRVVSAVADAEPSRQELRRN